jgi:arginase
MPRPYAILEAPSTLGLASDGVEHLPRRLLHLGLAERIHARAAAQLAVPPKDPIPDPETGILNAQAMADWSPKLADAVEAMLNAGDFPVVLGGDCTIVLGSMLALRRRGRYGLLFIDGNADFFQPDAEPNGEGASMDLAFVTGYGPSLLTNIEGRSPLVRLKMWSHSRIAITRISRNTEASRSPPNSRRLTFPLCAQWVSRRPRAQQSII